MKYLIKSSFVWQFAVGFALGAAGLVALHPAAAETLPAPTHFAR